MNVVTPLQELAATSTAPALSTDRRPATGPLPVVVIGGGPVGLAAAAELLERGIKPLILEAGTQPAAAVRAWGHVPMFSPWTYNIDKAARALLERHGWTAPQEDAYPTGHQLAEAYLDPLSRTPEIAARLRLGVRVTGVARVGNGKVRNAGREAQPFEVRFLDSAGREGRTFARAVIDASGTWTSPNPAGGSGLPAMGEREAAAAGRLRYGMPDILGAQRAQYAGKRVLVVGSGHSAAGTLIDLAKLHEAEPDTRVIWALRTRDHLTRVFGGGDQDQLAARGALGSALKGLVERGVFEIAAPFTVDTIEQAAGGTLQMSGESGDDWQTLQADAVIVATGLKPDLSFLAELRTDLDPVLDCPSALAPLIDPNLHSCGTVRPHGAIELAQPEPGLFIIGMKAYGRAPTFLLATGHEQARSVAAYLAGDIEAAKRVELNLPETGVCSGPGPVADVPKAASCCGPAPVAEATKASGCCGPATPQPAPVAATSCCGA
ncbi:FAD-dependent oxidoreductase [Roseicella sp. DB1501]|uniref:FAD-dependent oxidoreductase n=1 Tax=Roseicella sp. DB1501 TaxID=2730925 RepID=UPI001492E1A1|nr:FAD-dependent oxidoreductase [Roseicella sp. DB1501]NOG73539.1 FAD-dependent oxidoreductase [Roseicella sp. DB1501]